MFSLPLSDVDCVKLVLIVPKMFSSEDYFWRVFIYNFNSFNGYRTSRLSILSWLSLVFYSFLGIDPLLLVGDKYCFTSSESLWIPLHSWRIFLLIIGFTVNSSFLSMLEKCVPLLPLASMVLDKIPTVIHRDVSISKVSFSSDSFRIFFFVFD